MSVLLFVVGVAVEPLTGRHPELAGVDVVLLQPFSDVTVALVTVGQPHAPALETSPKPTNARSWAPTTTRWLRPKAVSTCPGRRPCAAGEPQQVCTSSS